MVQPNHIELDRRDFHKLTLAAMGGLMAGVAAGCGSTTPTPSAASTVTVTNPQTMMGASLSEEEKLIIDEPHVCRGLNSCKGLGRGKENACAGQGTCASIADAECGGHNECKGQGGCGELPGMNTCKGKGACHIPLMDDAWTKARAAFESAMKKSTKSFGPAPEKPKP